MPPLLPAARWALTPPFHPYPYKRGGIISVALSVGLPRPGVTRHRYFLESGLSSTPRDRDHPAFRAIRGLAGEVGSGQIDFKPLSLIVVNSDCQATG